MNDDKLRHTLIVSLSGEQECIDKFMEIINPKKENDYYFVEYTTTKGIFKFIFDNNIYNPYSIIYLNKHKKFDPEKYNEILKIKEQKILIACSDFDKLMYDENFIKFSEEYSYKNIGDDVHIITSFNTGLNKDLPFFYISRYYLKDNLYKNLNDFKFVNVNIIDIYSTYNGIYKKCVLDSENFETYMEFLNLRIPFTVIIIIHIQKVHLYLRNILIN